MESKAKTTRITSKTKFFPKDDEKLLTIIKAETGNIDWYQVANKMGPDFNYRQCFERWSFFLDPTINHTPFTEEEDKLLLEKVSLYSTHWATISQFFNARTTYALKNRYHQLETRAKKDIELSNAFKKLKVELAKFDSKKNVLPSIKPVPRTAALSIVPKLQTSSIEHRDQATQTDSILLEADLQPIHLDLSDNEIYAYENDF